MAVPVLQRPPQQPTAYSVDGTRYIAVPVGWGGWMEGFAPEMGGAPRGNALFAFALPQ